MRACALVSFITMWLSTIVLAAKTSTNTNGVHLDNTTWIPLGVFMTATGATTVFIFMLGVTYKGWKTKIDTNKKELGNLKDAVDRLERESEHHKD